MSSATAEANCHQDTTPNRHPRSAHLMPFALPTSHGDARTLSCRRDTGGAAAAALLSAPLPLLPAARSSCGLSAGTALASTLRRPRIVLVLPVPAQQQTR